MVVSTLFKDIRMSLADPDGDRWADDVLLTLLNSALYDLTVKLEYPQKTSYIALDKLSNTVDISELSLKLLRVEYNNKALPLYPHSIANERLGSNWQEQQGTTLKAVVFDDFKVNNLRLYPLLGTAQDVFEVEGSTNGVTFGIQFLDEGISTIIEQSGDIDITDLDNYIKIKYVVKPEEIYAIDDEIPVDNKYSQLLRQFILSECFKRDGSTQNLRTAGLYHTQYLQGIQEMLRFSAVGYTESEIDHKDNIGF